MRFRNLFREIQVKGHNRRRPGNRSHSYWSLAWFRPHLEILEDRTLLSNYLVTTTADSGPGSLRQAIPHAGWICTERGRVGDRGSLVSRHRPAVLSARRPMSITSCADCLREGEQRCGSICSSTEKRLLGRGKSGRSGRAARAGAPHAPSCPLSAWRNVVSPVSGLCPFPGVSWFPTHWVVRMSIWIFRGLPTRPCRATAACRARSPISTGSSVTPRSQAQARTTTATAFCGARTCASCRESTWEWTATCTLELSRRSDSTSFKVSLTLLTSRPRFMISTPALVRRLAMPAAMASALGRSGRLPFQIAMSRSTRGPERPSFTLPISPSWIMRRFRSPSVPRGRLPLSRPPFPLMSFGAAR